MPTPDDAFVQTLSRLASDVAPTIDVDTSRVASEGRRRRDRRHSLAAGTFGVLVIAGVGFAQAPAWTADPAVSAHESAPLERAGRADESIAPAITTFDAPAEATADDDPAGLPTALVVGLGAVGVGALGAGAFFAVRSRRHAR